MTRVVDLRLHDTHLGIWQDDAKDASFRRDIFLPLIKHLRARGWTVAPDPEVVKHRRCISPNYKLARKGKMQARLEIVGRSCSIDFWSNAARRDNPNGPRYDFDKFDRMPYLDRKRFIAECRAIRAWLATVAAVATHHSTRRRPRQLAADFIAAQYAEAWRTDKALGRPVCTQERNALSADGDKIEHGCTVWFRGRDGRWRRGRAFYNINNMWWVVQDKFDVRNLAAFDLRCQQPDNLREKRDDKARRAALERELTNAIQASNSTRAETIKTILFGPEAPHFIWSRKRSAYYAPLSRGYSDSILHAGHYTRDEAEAECRRVPHILEMVCPMGRAFALTVRPRDACCKSSRKCTPRTMRRPRTPRKRPQVPRLRTPAR